MSQDKIIGGKELSRIFKEEVKLDVELLKAENITPKLVVIIVGSNPASESYVLGKSRDCTECGIESHTIAFPQDATQEQLIAEIEKQNSDHKVHGILLQLPLPKHMDEYTVINTILPSKDVDGSTALNVGKFYIGRDCFVPCTPQGCIDMLKYGNIDVSGKNVVVLGRSNIVGKPVASLLMQMDATVTVCHTKTVNLSKITRAADIILMAIGKAGFLTGDMIKKGVAIVDVSINRNEDGELCGDVDFASCIDKVSKITPVPGGVGLMTRANLLKNTIKSAKDAKKQM